MRSLDRPIYRRRPAASTRPGRRTAGAASRPASGIGQTLKVTTTHLKDGYLKRGGPQTTDMLTMTEYITRHDDILSIVQVVDDPIYLDEPYVLSITYTYDPNAGPATENCSGSSFAENGGTDRHSRAAFPARPEQRHRRVPRRRRTGFRSSRCAVASRRSIRNTAR